eukprot:TRINITY_DN116_c0_g1_i2.p1 TRINITY_DN116_c0_g1~~TRINITY_DN116_c0_g1_i2.p1  ORF type:complete len:484 (+),score=144.53 TRINITY_DN116_c0_g1_i2:45-1496(+)
MKSLLSVAALGATAAVASAGKIKHVVLLMEENRSFDHMMGFFPGVNGLKGNESNPYNTSDPNSERVTVMKDSPYIGPFDPDHGTGATLQKVFGEQGLKDHDKIPKMDGFIEFESKRHKDPTSVMNMFTPERLPVMKALADEFAIFDRYFCSHNGPTWPNRLYQLMGSSHGCTSTSAMHPYTELYFGKTIFDLVEEVGLDWRMYYADAPLEMAFIEKLTTNPEKIHDWYRFKNDIKSGNLPTFSWVNPRWFVNMTSLEGANDQHPDHDVRLGEALMKDVYEMLRASPAWNETLFIITYDEHGGFYDHVPTPQNVPAPDDAKSFPDKNYNFTRLGVRIPTLLISPWVKKGEVINSKPSGPFPDSEFELTSVIATMGKMFGFKSHLSKRDAWAGTFEEYLSEETPRTDCPAHLPDAPKSLGAEHALNEAEMEINGLQQDIINAFVNMRGPSELTEVENLPKKQGEGSEWITKVTKEIMEGKNILHE